MGPWERDLTKSPSQPLPGSWGNQHPSRDTIQIMPTRPEHLFLFDCYPTPPDQWPPAVSVVREDSLSTRTVTLQSPSQMDPASPFIHGVTGLWASSLSLETRKEVINPCHGDPSPISSHQSQKFSIYTKQLLSMFSIDFNLGSLSQIPTCQSIPMTFFVLWLLRWLGLLCLSILIVIT